jgi:hypothetical protein
MHIGRGALKWYLSHLIIREIRRSWRGVRLKAFLRLFVSKSSIGLIANFSFNRERCGTSEIFWSASTVDGLEYVESLPHRNIYLLNYMRSIAQADSMLVNESSK